MRDKSDGFYSEMIERKRWPVCYGISEFVDWIKGSYYARKIDDDIPQSKELAPDETLIIKCVCEYYKVTKDTLMKSKRGEFNEPRNIAIYLFRTLRHDSLKIIGESFNDGLVKSQNLGLLPQLVGIVKVVNAPYIVVTKISPDFLRDHHLISENIIPSAA